MLSEDEQKVLDAIERDLAKSDPKLASRLARGRPRRRGWLLFLAIAGWISLPVTAVLGWWAVTVALLAPVMLLAGLALIHEYRQDG